MNYAERFKAYCALYFPFFIAMPALLWQLLFFYVPIVFLLIRSFSTTDSTVPADYFGESYLLFFDSMYLVIIARSLILAFLSATFCVLLAVPIAYYIAFVMRRG